MGPAKSAEIALIRMRGTGAVTQTNNQAINHLTGNLVRTYFREADKVYRCLQGQRLKVGGRVRKRNVREILIKES